MSDTNFDTGRSVSEKLQAEVLEESPETYFVKYGEHDADIEPKSRLNEAIFGAEDDVRDTLYDFLVYGEPIKCTWTEEPSFSDKLNRFLSNKEAATTHELVLQSYDGGTYFEIEQDGEETPVPSHMNDEIIETVTTFGGSDNTLCGKLRSYRERIESEYANRNLVEAFVDRYPSDRVRPSRRGWVVDESFIVHYDGANYFLDDPGTYERSGGDVEQVDDTHESVDLSFEIVSPQELTAPNGEEYELGENELQFLATVEVLLFPEEYLGYDDAGRVIDHRTTGGDEETPDDPIAETASSAHENAFKESTGQVHNHSREKHTLTSKFSVTQEVIDRMHFDQNGHAGVNELARRESEFRRANFDVFHDTNNEDDERWRSVKSSARSAPISAETQQDLDAMFGNVQ